VKVEAAGADDLAEILAWLEQEKIDAGYSFIVNEGTIRDYFDSGELFVIRRDGKAVAFQAKRYSPAISAVRPDLRGQGIGRVLAEWTIADALDADVCALEIQCQPGTSIPFWRSMGFTIEKDGEFIEFTGSAAHLVLTREFGLPAAAKPADVLVEFYEVGSSQGGEGKPLSTHRPEAVSADDGRISLARRVVGYHPGARSNDLNVRIVVEGKQLVSDRAKYRENVGLRRDRHSGAFYLDWIDAAAAEPG
jgi:GNAT superfamily N-acetyltransferase